MKLGISVDDLFCMAACDRGGSSTQEVPTRRTVFGLGLKMLHADGTYILEKKSPGFGFGNLAREFDALSDNPNIREVPKPLGLAEGLRSPDSHADADDIRDPHTGLPYLSVLFDAIGKEAGRFGVGPDLDLAVAVPGIAACLTIAEEEKRKPRIRGCHDALSQCVSFMMDSSPVLTDFEDAGLCAGFRSVSCAWTAHLLGGDILRTDIDVRERLGEERKSFVIVEVQNDGLLLTPISRARQGKDAVLSRPSLWVPFAFAEWLKVNLSATDETGFGELSDEYKATYLERFLGGVGFAAGPGNGFIEGNEEGYGDKDGPHPRWQEPGVKCETVGLFRDGAFTSDIANYHLVEDDLAFHLALQLLRKIYGDDEVDEAAIGKGLEQSPGIEPDHFKGFMKVFDRWDDESTGVNVMDVVGYRLTGSLAAHPILGPVINKAVRMMLWLPEVQPDFAIRNHETATIGEAAVLALKADPLGNPKAPFSLPKSAALWSSVLIEFYEGDEPGANLTYEVKVPELTEEAPWATVTKWFKDVGDTVAAEEPLVEIETDDTKLNVSAPAGGRIESINNPAKEIVQSGALLCVIDGNINSKVAAPVNAPDTEATENLALTRRMIAGNRSLNLGCRITLGRRSGSEPLVCELDFDLEEHHVDRTVEVEVRIDRTEKALVAGLIDGRPFPAKSLERIGGPDSTIIRPAAFGAFEVFVDARHERFARTKSRLNGSADKPWSVLSDDTASGQGAQR